VSCLPLAWLSFLVGVGAGVVLLAVLLHYVDKGMRL
jgi:hypothetical protein